MKGRSSLPPRWSVVLIVAAVLAVFGPVARYAFVYDDHWTIVHNEGLGAPLTRVLNAILHGQAARLGLADATRPVMVVSMWLDRALFGLSARAFHVHSLLLYVAVTLVAWRVLRLFVGRERGALFGALFFALAPLHAEVVAAINYREDLLAAFFELVVLLVVFSPRSDRPSFLEVAIVTAATALAVCAKESAVALPVLVAAIAWARDDDRAFLRKREALFTAMVVVVVLYLNWRMGVNDDVPRTTENSWAVRVPGTARYELHAALSAVVPFAASPERAKMPPASAFFLLPVAILVAAAVRTRRRPWSIAIVVALVAPLASSPLVGPVNEIADRYFFLAILGGAVAFGAATDRLPHRWVTPPAVMVLIVAAVTASYARRVFATDDALWTAAVRTAPTSARAWTGLARARRLAGDLDGADDAVAHALGLDPEYEPAHLTRAYNCIARGDVNGARMVLKSLSLTNVGSAKLPGLALAESCAALEPEAAKACITR